MSEVIGDVKIDTIAEQEQQTAELLVIDSADVSPEEVEFWREAGLVFLRDLSKDSFQLRFGTQKPDDDEQLQKIVDYFVLRKENHHQMLLILHKDRLIAAASLFDYCLKDAENSDTVVEISVTVADGMQGQSLGSILISEAVYAAVMAGKTHAYTSFNQGNEKSRRVVTRILGTANLVAGQSNLCDKFWRLPGVDTKLHEDLEIKMKYFCGDDIAPEFESIDNTVTSKARRLSRVLHLPL